MATLLLQQSRFRNKISRKWRNGESTIGGGAHLRRPAAARMRRVANWAQKKRRVFFIQAITILRVWRNAITIRLFRDLPL
jgi:hypothetical protein